MLSRGSMMAAMVALLLSGCEPNPQSDRQYDQTNAAEYIPAKDDSRVVVTRVSVVRDNLAYNGQRGVYIIKDGKTGREFVGVSGIGIAEVVQSGKTVAER